MKRNQGVKLCMKWKREILRHHFQLKMGNNEIARILGKSPSTVSGVLTKAKSAGIDSFQMVEILQDKELENALETAKVSEETNPCEEFDIPDWESVLRESRKKGVTIFLLYQEYCQEASNPRGKTWFYTELKRFRQAKEARMSFSYQPGERLFVDFSGLKLRINTGDGGHQDLEVFVAVSGYSDLIYADLCDSQAVPDWIEMHNNCFEYFGGVPRIIVPDNLKSAVSKACRYEPDINPTYRQLAEHYSCAIIPARVKKARDKARVEKAVQSVQRQILAVMRNLDFFSKQEARKEFFRLLQELNQKPFQKEEGCRFSKFEEEKESLTPLPENKFRVCETKELKVAFDYHIAVDKKRYSVPYQLLHKQVMVRIEKRIIEIFYDGERVALHQRIQDPKIKFSTIYEHMPSHHKAYAEWNPGRIINWANQYGAGVKKFAGALLASMKIPEQGFTRLSGIFNLSKKYSPQELNRACEAAIRCSSYSYKYVKQWLKDNAIEQSKSVSKPENIQHENLQGKQAFE